jgi:hypothetical protein
MTSNKTRKTKKPQPHLFALLASVLVLSSVSVAQLVANSNAYAQSTVTVTGTCGIMQEPESSNRNLFARIQARVDEPQTPYYEQILDSSGTVLRSGLLGTGPGVAGTDIQFPAQPGETYTYNLYQDTDDDFSTVGVEEDELVASETVTCPSYTDLFRNEGQCINFVRTYPGGAITKSGCQEAF